MRTAGRRVRLLLAVAVVGGCSSSGHQATSRGVSPTFTTPAETGVSVSNLSVPPQSPTTSAMPRVAKVLATCSPPAQYEPTAITLACGDGNKYIDKLTWSSWTGTSATAQGVLHTNNCTPACANGTFAADPARIGLGDVEVTANGPLFVTAQVTCNDSTCGGPGFVLTPGPAVNLVADSQLEQQLGQAYAVWNKLPNSDVNGTKPGSLYYGLDVSNFAYFAVATIEPSTRFDPSKDPGLFQAPAVFVRAHPDRGWEVLTNVLPAGSCPIDVPPELLAAWNWHVCDLDASDTGVLADCFRAVTHPDTIIFACADGNALVKEIRWTLWNAQTATGSGLYSVNDCQPTCAGGTFHVYPVNLLLSAPTVTAPGSRFRNVAITWTGSQPSGAQPSPWTIPLNTQS